MLDSLAVLSVSALAYLMLCDGCTDDLIQFSPRAGHPGLHCIFAYAQRVGRLLSRDAV